MRGFIDPASASAGIARIKRRLIFTTPGVDSTGYQNVVIKLIVPAECWLLAYLAADADRNAISPALLALETSPAN